VFKTAAPDLDEQALISQAQSGDRPAFSELVRRHRQGVVNVVYRMCADVSLAEEAAQEAFIRTWQNLQRYNPHFAFRSWLYRIALNVALDTLRSEQQTRSLADLPLDEHPQAPDSSDPEVALERKERATQVRQAVLALPPASRAVLILREYEGMSYHEISTALDIPVGTVMSRLNYARSQVRLALSEGVLVV